MKFKAIILIMYSVHKFDWNDSSRDIQAVLYLIWEKP